MVKEDKLKALDEELGQIENRIREGICIRKTHRKSHSAFEVVFFI